MKFIFCEGKNDVEVLEALSKHLKLNIQIESFGGTGNLSNFLRELPKRPMFARQEVAAIAIVRDADEDAKTAFISVRDTLRHYNFGAPDNDADFINSAIRVGIFIVGINGKGMIEDLCLTSVAHHQEFQCVNTYFDCIARYSERKQFSSKAKVRVWMASQVDHELHAGKAAKEGYWPWESPAFDSLKTFLRAL